MKKSARNKSKRVKNGSQKRVNLDGLSSANSREVRNLRTVIWSSSTPCDRLTELLDHSAEYYPEKIKGPLLDAFHAGAVDYDGAVLEVMTLIAMHQLNPYFVICSEQRLRSAADSADYMYQFWDPSEEEGTAFWVINLLEIAHLYSSREAFTYYRAALVRAVERLLEEAILVQERLDSGELCWDDVHPDCGDVGLQSAAA